MTRIRHAQLFMPKARLVRFIAIPSCKSISPLWQESVSAKAGPFQISEMAFPLLLGNVFLMSFKNRSAYGAALFPPGSRAGDTLGVPKVEA